MREEQLHYFGLVSGGVFAGRYEIVRKLGAGGMGMVFEVLDLSLQRERVALKIFSPAETDEEASLRSRFQNEVLITRRLTHPNIVRTFDFAEVEDALIYMTMEYVDGWSLEQHLRASPEKRLDVETAIAILKEVAKGVHYAHTHGVVHRDLKPANVLLDRSGEIKVTDFGLAQSLATRERLTMTGECVGTPAYMSPEQVLGQTADPRSDIYALGMIAYELVIGKLPFRNKGWFELANQIVNEPIEPFAAQTKHIPGWFENFVMRATEKQPQARFPSVQALLESLDSGQVPAVPNILLSGKSTPGKSLSGVSDTDLRNETVGVSAVRSKGGIHLSLTVPGSAVFWFAVIALIFVFSSLGVQNWLLFDSESNISNEFIPRQKKNRSLQREEPGTEKRGMSGSNKSLGEVPSEGQSAELSQALTNAFSEELESLDSGNGLVDKIEEITRSDFFSRTPSQKERQQMREQFLKRKRLASERDHNKRLKELPSDQIPRGYRSIR